MPNNIKAKGSKAKEDTGLSEEQRQCCIEVAAFYLAEKNKSDCCCDLDNWLAAEAEVDQLLAEDKL